MKKVGHKEFASFDEVVAWAWNTHKVDLNVADRMDEDMERQACEELSELLLREGICTCDAYETAGNCRHVDEHLDARMCGVEWDAEWDDKGDTTDFN